MRNLFRLLFAIATIFGCALATGAARKEPTITRPIGADGCCPACGEPQYKVMAYKAGCVYCSRCGTRLMWRKEKTHEH